MSDETNKIKESFLQTWNYNLKLQQQEKADNLSTR